MKMDRMSMEETMLTEYDEADGAGKARLFKRLVYGINTDYLWSMIEADKPVADALTKKEIIGADALLAVAKIIAIYDDVSDIGGLLALSDNTVMTSAIEHMAIRIRAIQCMAREAIAQAEGK